RSADFSPLTAGAESIPPACSADRRSGNRRGARPVILPRKWAVDAYEAKWSDTAAGATRWAARLQRGDGGFVHLKPHRDLMHAPMSRHHFAQLRIEVVLEHGGTRMFQVEVRIIEDIGTGHHIQLIERRDMLDDAGSVSKAHFPERISAVASVIEDDSIPGADGIEEIGAEAHRQPDDTHE